MDNLYKIPPDALSSILKRGLLRQIKIMTIILAITAIPQFFRTNGFVLAVFLKATLGVIILITIGLCAGYIRAKRTYSSMAIKLDEHGVEITATNIPKKAIKWENLAIKTKSNGDITIYDLTFSAYQRNFNGQGVFVIPAEIYKRDKLLGELWARLN